MDRSKAKSLLLVALIAGLTNCGSESTGLDTGGNAVRISKTSINLTFLGETTQLTATVSNSKGESYSLPLATDLVSPDRGPPGVDLRNDIHIGPILTVGPKKR